ncbi:MAG: hypothetical protein ACYDA0_04175 [Candidatus Dormibacteraceae bacterium]
MARILLSLVVVLTAVGCQPATAAAHPKPVTAQSIALQPGDVFGLQKCDGSGDVQTVLRKEKSNDPVGYYVNATEWEQWKTQGATEAYFAAYGRTSADCDALSAADIGAPSGGLMAGLVVKFKDATIAARTYRADSTLLGFGPKDITFIKLVGGSVLTGSDTGLGSQSVIGSGSVAGTTYYFAFWQNKVVDSFFIAYDLPAAAAEGATRNVNQRMS